jgi:ankyrin repeat protein
MSPSSVQEFSAAGLPLELPSIVAQAAVEGDEELVLEWLESPEGDIDAREEQHRGTMLISAALHGRQQLVELLLKRGASIDAQHIFGYSALMASAMHGHVGTTRVLLAAGADVGLASNVGETALDVAERNGRTEVVLLLQGGADALGGGQGSEGAPELDAELAGTGAAK